MLKWLYMRIRKTRANLSIVILGFAIILLLLGIIAKKQPLFVVATNDSSELSDTSLEETADHYITFFDNGTSFTVRSDAKTVGEALERANITIGEHDTIEPAKDERIAEEDFNINIYRAREVIVIDGYVKKYVKTAKTDPDEVVQSAGIELLDADVVEVVLHDNLLESGMTSAYRVVRAKTVNLNFYGKATQVRTQAKTVAEFLKEQKISSNTSKNWISIPKNQKITDGLTFSVFHQGKQTVTVEEDIPFTESVTYDYSVDYGTRNSYGGNPRSYNRHETKLASWHT